MQNPWHMAQSRVSGPIYFQHYSIVCSGPQYFLTHFFVTLPRSSATLLPQWWPWHVFKRTWPVWWCPLAEDLMVKVWLDTMPVYKVISLVFYCFTLTLTLSIALYLDFDCNVLLRICHLDLVVQPPVFDPWPFFWFCFHLIFWFVALRPLSFDDPWIHFCIYLRCS